MISRKLINRSAEVLKPLSVDRTAVEAAWARAEGLMPALDPVEMARVNAGLPAVLSALASPTLGVTGLDESGLAVTFAALTRKLGCGEPFDDVVLTVALGAAETAPSVRLPAFLVPALRSLKAMRAMAREGGIVGTARLRVYKCDGIGILTNGLDPLRVAATSALTCCFLRAFLDEFYPDLADLVAFEADTSLDPALGFDGEVASSLVALGGLLKGREAVADQLATIRGMAEKYAGHGAGEAPDVDALGRLYAAAHPVYDGSLRLPVGSPFPPSPLASPSLVIVHVGPPQRVFVPVSRSLLDGGGLPEGSRVAPTLHLAIRAGKRPVYYPARDGDLLIDAPAVGVDFSRLDRACRGDFDLLFSETSPRRYREFLERFRLAEGHGPPPIVLPLRNP